VRIKAPNRLFDQINSETVRAILELSNARVDQTEFPINRNMIYIPQGAEVREISPGQVRMRLERTKEIFLDVEVDIIGQLADGLELEGIEAIPNQVSIIGPESKVKDSYKVKTSPIDISALTETTEVQADLILPDPENLRLVSLETIITVRIIIAERTEEESPGAKKKRKVSK
jgi:YbbR domain-containing protein